MDSSKLQGLGMRGLMVTSKKYGFQESASKPTLYIKTKGANEVLIVCLYVDDLIYIGTSIAWIDDFKKIMISEFEMSNLGSMSYFLGLEVQQNEAGIFISQQKYLNDLEKFNLKFCNHIKTPMVLGQNLKLDDGEEKVDARVYRSLVDSLLYLTNSRPNVLYAIRFFFFFRFMKNPNK